MQGRHGWMVNVEWHHRVASSSRNNNLEDVRRRFEITSVEEQSRNARHDFNKSN